ncbi:molybdenum cofactor cytidylyltransferase [Caulobacter ginsengisoli]|uniref:Molybdenum cofactor cytidylyltransferase n=1 Tax=Caulobacter ginsengisoli TaxID=400775 RepID=A0ABU0ITZ7_9CAUL|nr:nucleotidyltransferase family protein [Caulobacter ginsengisoli]MDQ0465469.1 molybdenum cofactor cytidylyltransferase [Caulobacter ginsengisoli]
MATGPLEAIVLAAGLGARFGGGKLTSPYQGGQLLDGAIQAALMAPVRSVRVVTGHDAEAVAATARRLGAVEIVHAERHAEGMAESLKAGIASLPGDTAGVFVFLGDMPAVPADMAAKLAAALGAADAAAPVCDDRRGHPVLLSARLFPALMTLTGDQGAGRLLKDNIALVPTEDHGVLFDVDTP